MENNLRPGNIERIKELAHSNSITFLDYGQAKQFQNAEFFQDASLLNETGANAYTKEV